MAKRPAGKYRRIFVSIDFSGSTFTSIEGSAFSGCTNLTGITIPDSVTGIGEGAFRECTSLAGVTIGNSVESIGEFAFWACTNLTSVTFERADTSITDDYSFPGGGSLRTAYSRGGIGTYARESGGTTFRIKALARRGIKGFALQYLHSLGHVHDFTVSHAPWFIWEGVKSYLNLREGYGEFQRGLRIVRAGGQP